MEVGPDSPFGEPGLPWSRNSLQVGSLQVGRSSLREGRLKLDMAVGWRERLLPASDFCLMPDFGVGILSCG